MLIVDAQQRIHVWCHDLVRELLVSVSEHRGDLGFAGIMQLLRRADQRRNTQAAGDQYVMRLILDLEGVHAQRAEHVDAVAHMLGCQVRGALADHGEDDAHLIADYLAYAERTRHKHHFVVGEQVDELRRPRMLGNVWILERHTNNTRGELFDGGDGNGMTRWEIPCGDGLIHHFICAGERHVLSSSLTVLLSDYRACRSPRPARSHRPVQAPRRRSSSRCICRSSSTRR